jgi:putative restriction endonuclease
MPDKWGRMTPVRKNWIHAAAKIWPLLTEGASKQQLLTYGDIAPFIETNSLNVGRALGPIQDYCLDTDRPPLTAIVVNKGTRLPGAGFIAASIENWREAVRSVHEWDWASVPNPFTAFTRDNSLEVLVNRLINSPDEAETIYQLMPTRGFAQRFFRDALLMAYNGESAMCGLSFESALDAAHIIPWAVATPQQRMDVRNGVLLCSSHHKLFDEDWFSFDDEYRVHYTVMGEEYGPYSDADKALSIRLNGKRLRLPADQAIWPRMSERALASA